MSFGPVAYYNEIDPVAAQWLRNLITAGHIAPGWVDERSIEDVRPEELEGFTQCHFFAGVGVWSLALRRAGWPDDRPIWTGSCPCQPFSASGQKGGFDDERHLWPAFYWLIEQRRPRVVAGEQVSSKAAEPWLDLVQTDLEAVGYAFGAVAFPSAGVGAPHIRDRTYWVGHADQQGLEGLTGDGSAAGWQEQSGSVAETGVPMRVGNAASPGSLSVAQSGVHSSQESAGPRNVESERSSAVGGLADADLQYKRSTDNATGTRDTGGPIEDSGAGPTNSFWRDADWLFCRDGKWRPVEPGTFPLADGAPARVGRLRAYGNAINVEAAKEFITAFMGATK